MRLFVSILLSLLCLPALAHKPNDSPLAVEVLDAIVDVQWDIALRDIDLSATSVQGGGFGEGVVRITLVGGPDLLIDEIVRTFERYFERPSGTGGSLNIEAVGSADAATVGDIAVGSASVSFGLRPVPAPAGLALLLAAVLGAVMASRGTGLRGASLRLAA